jgi:hypothetical protein
MTTSRLRAPARLLARSGGTAADAAAAYRGTRILGFRSPITKLAEASDELAAAVFFAEQEYLLAMGSELSRVRALEGINALLASAPSVLSGKELEHAQVLLAARRHVLLDGWQGAERQAKGLLADIGSARALERAELLAGRMAATDVRRIAATIEALGLDALARPATTRAQRALRLFMQAVPPTDTLAWGVVHHRIANLRKLSAKAKRVRTVGGPDRYGEEAFRTLFRGEASNLKGLLLETWFWTSTVWRRREPAIIADAYARARKLSAIQGAELTPAVVREPLREARYGREMYDGAVLLVRPTAANPDVYEAFPHLLVQIKAEKDISVVGQIARDIKRERRVVPGDLLLRRSDSRAAYVLRPAPDELDPVRIIIAPQLPEPKRLVGDLPPGVDVVVDASLLDADELDDVAYALLRAIVEH